MRILLVNVNTTAAITAAMVEQARAVAAAETEIIGLTPSIGATSVEGNFESYLAAVAVIDVVQSYKGPYDAVIQAGFGEHGREALQELLAVPVVDLTEAAVLLAHLLGHRYSIVTTLDRTVPLIENRLKLAGLDAHCVSIRSSGLSVLELERDEERTTKAIVAQSVRAVREDRAEVICLGCGGMAGLSTAVAMGAGVPVVDGVTAGTKLAESLVALHLSTSKVRTYALPRTKTVLGWPLHQSSAPAAP